MEMLNTVTKEITISFFRRVFDENHDPCVLEPDYIDQ